MDPREGAGVDRQMPPPGAPSRPSWSLPETTIVEIRRHPFGMIVAFGLSLLALFLSLSVIVFFVPEGTSANTYAAIAGGAGLALIIVLVFLLIYSYIYRESRLVVTSSNLSQTMQLGLFNRKISKLSMASVEDVSAVQKGFFATVLNFGTLIVETAGEQQNFSFSYCPNPNHYAKEILAAREQFVNQDLERAYRITHHHDLD